MDDNTSPSDAPAQIKTPLRLDERQELRLMDFAIAELEAACFAMGRGKSGEVVAGSWLDKRRLNQLWYEGDLSWREGDQYLGGVFNDSNFTRGDGKRYVRHMAAKVTDDLLGTTPCFAAMKKDTAGPATNAQLIGAVESVTQDAVDSSKVLDVLREAVELALARNEAVVKLRNVLDITAYVGPAEVLVDAVGQPIVTPGKKLYVYRNDDMLPVPEQPGTLALEKDASFTVTEADIQAFRYQQFSELPQTEVEREGLEGRVIDPRDFICDPQNECIHSAAVLAHYFDESPTVLKQLYGGYDVGTAYFNLPESGAKAAIAVQGEQDGRPGQSQSQWVPMAETYLRFDADEDGREEHILLVFDRSTGKPLFYDYLSNHLKKRPFEVLHGLRKVPARWYGVGIFSDKFDQLVFVDKTYNRINLKSSKTCTVTAVRREAIEEWSDQKQPVTFGGDEVLTLNAKWAADRGEWLEQKRLVELTAEEVELMQQTLQAMDQEFGYISAADASASGLNQSKTATGIASIERSGNNIVKAVERVQGGGITSVLIQAVDIILENLDTTRLAMTKNAELLTLNREEIRGLPRNVRLLLTRSRSSELLVSNEAATQKANEFFDILEAKPRRAKALRPMYLSQLKALEVQDADDILPEVTDEMITAVEGAQAPKEPPRQSVSIPFKNLFRSEQAQVLQGIGITPAGDQEVSGAMAAQAQAESQEAQPGETSERPQPNE